jgi:hypothetical protein
MRISRPRMMEIKIKPLRERTGICVLKPKSNLMLSDMSIK